MLSAVLQVDIRDLLLIEVGKVEEVGSVGEGVEEARVVIIFCLVAEHKVVQGAQFVMSLVALNAMSRP